MGESPNDHSERNYRWAYRGVSTTGTGGAETPGKVPQQEALPSPDSADVASRSCLRCGKDFQASKADRSEWLCGDKCRDKVIGDIPK